MIFKRKKMKKKGQIQQIMFVMVFIVMFAVSVLLGRVVLDQFDEKVEAGGKHTNESRAAIDTFQDSWATFDSLIVFVVVGLTLGLLVTSWLLPSHPVFVVVNIVGIFVLVLGAAILSNVYEEIRGTDLLNTMVSDPDYPFGSIDFVMTKLPWICVVITVLSSIVLYVKRGSASSGGGL